MTQRLPLYVSASLLAHLALLLVWRVVPIAPSTPAETGLQVSLVQNVPQRAATTPAHDTASIRQSSTLAKARHAPGPRHAPASIPAPPMTAVTTTLTEVSATPTPPLSASTLSDDVAARLQTAMRIAFNRYFSYPAMALRHGWKGVVKISLRLEADGHLSEVRLIQSSGHSALDAAALASAQRIPPLLDAVAWLQGNARVILLPVEYQLIDG